MSANEKRQAEVRRLHEMLEEVSLECQDEHMQAIISEIQKSLYVSTKKSVVEPAIRNARDYLDCCGREC